METTTITTTTTTPTTTATSTPTNLASENVQVWIFFQGGQGREFSRLLRNKLTNLGTKTGIDEDFQLIYVSQNYSLRQCIIKSIKHLVMNKGVALIVFNQEFFKDGKKGGFNPSDEMSYLLFNFISEDLKVIPIWLNVLPEQVSPPEYLKHDYQTFCEVPGFIFNEPNNFESKFEELIELIQKYLRKLRPKQLTLRVHNSIKCGFMFTDHSKVSNIGFLLERFDEHELTIQKYGATTTGSFWMTIDKSFILMVFTKVQSDSMINCLLLKKSLMIQWKPQFVIYGLQNKEIKEPKSKIEGMEKRNIEFKIPTKIGKKRIISEKFMTLMEDWRERYNISWGDQIEIEWIEEGFKTNDILIDEREIEYLVLEYHSRLNPRLQLESMKPFQTTTTTTTTTTISSTPSLSSSSSSQLKNKNDEEISKTKIDESSTLVDKTSNPNEGNGNPSNQTNEKSLDWRFEEPDLYSVPFILDFVKEEKGLFKIENTQFKIKLKETFDKVEFVEQMITSILNENGMKIKGLTKGSIIVEVETSLSTFWELKWKKETKQVTNIEGIEIEELFNEREKEFVKQIEKEREMIVQEMNEEMVNEVKEMNEEMEFEETNETRNKREGEINEEMIFKKKTKIKESKKK